MPKLGIMHNIYIPIGKRKHNVIEYKAYFWRIVYSTYEAEFIRNLNVLREVDESVADGFIARDPKVFCRAYIQTLAKCEHVDNNIAETFTGWICRARTMPIIQMLEEIRTALMERMKIKTDSMTNSFDVLCPKVRKKVKKIEV